MSAYKQGFIDGLEAYAIMKNGVSYIGNDRPLRQCIKDVENTWNYNEPKAEENQ